MYNWINILYPVYILITAYCHCLMSVYFHCRALRAFVPICILTGSFQGPYPGPLNKHLYTIICAFISIHCHRPSAQATPKLGVVSLWHKTGTQCGACDWWLVPQKCINIKQQQHVGWPAADLKAIQKLTPFDETTAVNVQLFSNSWLWQCVMPSHSAIQMELCAQGLCPYNIGGW